MSKSIYESMSEKGLDEMASTKRRGKPEHRQRKVSPVPDPSQFQIASARFAKTLPGRRSASGPLFVMQREASSRYGPTGNLGELARAFFGNFHTALPFPGLEWACNPHRGGRNPGVIKPSRSTRRLSNMPGRPRFLV